MRRFSIRKAGSQAALILAMLAGGLVVGGLSPAYSADPYDLDAPASALATLRDGSGVVVGRATLSPRGNAVLVSLDMSPGHPGDYLVGVTVGPCGGVRRAAPATVLAKLGVAVDGSARLDAEAAEATASPAPGDALVLSADGGRAACGVFSATRD